MKTAAVFLADGFEENEEATEELNLMKQNRMLLDILMTMHQRNIL